jgi:acetyl-CoA carboxylase carboxyl transferase subunit alpha
VAQNVVPDSNYLAFEKPILELEIKIREFEELSKANNMDFTDEIESFRKRQETVTKEIFANLTDWQRVELARHPRRPQTLDYVGMICTDFVELAGDRMFGNDRAIVTGLGTIKDRRVMLIGQQKGRNTKEAIACNWGCPLPEGYRKALRKMKLAERFRLPIVSLIDTRGAHPGIEAEERGQSLAIAENLEAMAMLRTPIVCIVISEGGSGGALGIGVGDRVGMLQYAWYSVISPEGCAAILWKTETAREKAAAALKLTSTELLKLGVIDEIVPEPLGGAHRDPSGMAETLATWITQKLDEVAPLSENQLLDLRYERIRKWGVVREGKGIPLAPEPPPLPEGEPKKQPAKKK